MVPLRSKLYSGDYRDKNNKSIPYFYNIEDNFNTGMYYDRVVSEKVPTLKI